MDSTVKEKMQHGNDPMDVGAVGGWSWYGDVSEDASEAYEGVYAVGFKGQGKGKGTGKMGKSKGKGLQGWFYTCGDSGSSRKGVLQERRRVKKKRR